MKKPAKKAAPKRKAKRSPEPDFNQLAHQLIKMTTEQPGPSEVPTESEISRVMRELGRRGGKIGGKKRAAGMTDRQRSDAAALAARARWGKPKEA